MNCIKPSNSDPKPNTAVADLHAQIASLIVERWSIGKLKPNPGNARTHPTKQIALLSTAILEFGFLVPIVVDDDGMVLAGHARLAAAKALDLQEVPVLRVSEMTEEKRRLFVLADNKLAQLAGWDEDMLRLEFTELEALEIDVDLEITGFDSIEIDRLTLDEREPEVDPGDTVPALGDGAMTVSRLGDLWLLGDHRLLCGDARDPAAYATLLGDAQAQMAITDPPYNVPIEGHVSGKGSVQHPEFVMASGEMSTAAFQAFLEDFLRCMAAVSVDGSIHYVFMDWRHLSALEAAALPHFGNPKNLIVWNKGNAGMGTFYRSQHEEILVFKKGAAAHINNFGLGERGRYRTNVWDYAGVNAFSSDRAETLAMHPTVKPVAMIADAMRDCSKRGGLVLDPFAGSGTTLIAAERTKRRARCMDLDPRYVDVAVRRWQAQTGTTARLASSGASFETVEEDRATPDPIQEVNHA